MNVCLGLRLFFPKADSLSSMELAEIPWNGHVSRSG
jgi:hypothetical protein